MKEGYELINNMMREYKLKNWKTYISDKDLADYINEHYRGRVNFDMIFCGRNNVLLNGCFSIPELEAILITLYHERGEIKE